ncbi:MAG: glycosyltransferase, partial [Candidatus Limnocylindria bacterium]
ETDLAFLALARALGIPVLTYVRDAQYLFDEYYDSSSPKRRLARALFLPAISLLRRVSSRLAYPSMGLARSVREPSSDPLLLPPGSPPPVRAARSPDARGLLFVGSMKYAVHGLDLLVGAMERVRAAGHDLRIICVSRPGEEPPQPRPDWMRVERGSAREIQALLPETLATIQPRLCSPYNDLAVPIKVMEYLSYGRPLVVTSCTEQARIVSDAEAGIVVDDTIDDLARGLERLVSASEAEVNRWSDNATAAAERSSWANLAGRVVGLLADLDR